MPAVYEVMAGANFTTSATPLTEIDALFMKPGAVRTLWLLKVWMTGKAAAGTSLNGIVQRIKVWTSTAAAGGTGITPSPVDGRAGGVAASSTAGQATAGVTPGTGGPALRGGLGCSSSGPSSGWDYLNNIDRAIDLDGAANQSIDLFNSAGSASLPFETGCTIME